MSTIRFHQSYSKFFVLLLSLFIFSSSQVASATSIEFKPGNNVNVEKLVDINYQTVSATTTDIPGEQISHTYNLNSAITGYLVYLPKDYNSGKKYPMVLFLHGAGEVGSNINMVRKHGPPKMADQGEDFPFILVSPQAKYTWDHNGPAIDQFVEQMKKDYRVDENRFYVTGLSMGGAATWNYTTDYDHKVAAAVPICGWGNPSRACEMKTVPVWAFHNQGDGTVGVGGTINMVNALEKCPANPMPKETIYQVSGHDAWTKTYNNDAMWDWMLSQSKDGMSSKPVNKAPIANAGGDKSLTLPNNSVTLYGSGTDSDGTITSYQWTKTSGPTATLTDAHKAALKLSNLTQGSYTFKLTVSDNNGLKSSDDVNVSVNSGPSYIPSEKLISINFNNGYNQSSPWNNTASNPYMNKKLTNLKDSEGKTTSVSLTFLSSWGGTGTNSTASDNLYPHNINKTYYWTASPGKETLKLSGLDKNLKYDIVFFASRNGSGNKNTDYTIGSEKVTLNASNNTSNTVEIGGVSPNSAGEVFIYVNKGSQSAFGYLNSMVIKPSGSSSVTTTPSSDIVHRINAGGGTYGSGPTWEQDNRSRNSRHLNAKVSSDSQESKSWGSRKNTTSAPDHVLKSVKYEASWTTAPLEYNLPVSNGKYTVNLFFAEYEYSGIRSAGQRVFHVSLEKNRVLSNFDVYAVAGKDAIQKSFVVDVTDGSIDLLFERVKNQPIISGIEVVKGTSATSSNTNISTSISQIKSNEALLVDSDLNQETNSVLVYPNPALNDLSVEFFSEQAQNISVMLIDLSGKIVQNDVFQVTDGDQKIQVMINNNIDPGLFILKIKFENGKTLSKKLIRK